ncbi:MAG: PD-(D/E)XK nuclease family protein, partial [Burkholderiaceae bacterium]
WVQAMQHGPAAWVWDKARVQQEANEVDVYTSNGWGRIDRLIWDGQTQCWWVLDYKSAAHPAQHQASLAQVRGYMAAVQQWFAGQTVRGALIGSNGDWTEVS